MRGQLNELRSTTDHRVSNFIGRGLPGGWWVASLQELPGRGSITLSPSHHVSRATPGRIAPSKALGKLRGSQRVVAAALGRDQAPPKGAIYI